MNALMTSQSSELIRPELSPADAIRQLIRKHGVLRVLAALLAHPFRPPDLVAEMHEVALTAHLRRDIGMHPAPEARKDWRLYR
jgi:hypothetical protein